MEEKENKMNFHMMSFEMQTAPQYLETATRAGYIKYGEDNLWPDYLISLMNMSSKHNTILKRKAMMIGGNGWNLEGLDGIAQNFIANPYNELDLNDIVFRSAYDLEVFGAFALEIIYSKDRSKIAEVNYIPNNKVRLSEDGKSIFYSNDWSNLRKFAPIKYPIFNPRNAVASQILYVKEYRPGVEYYGQPEYLPNTNWIELEYEISNFHLNQVKRGFAPQMSITFGNIPSDDEIKDTIRRLKAEFQGSKGEPIMFFFADGMENAPKLEPIQLNDSDERFVQLNKEITEGIFTGHGVTNPALFGVKTEGEMGMKNVIMESLEIFQSMYVAPKQKLVERVYNTLLNFNGSRTPLTLNKYQLDITKIEVAE